MYIRVFLQGQGEHGHASRSFSLSLVPLCRISLPRKARCLCLGGLHRSPVLLPRVNAESAERSTYSADIHQ